MKYSEKNRYIHIYLQNLQNSTDSKWKGTCKIIFYTPQKNYFVSVVPTGDLFTRAVSLLKLQKFIWQ